MSEDWNRFFGTGTIIALVGWTPLLAIILFTWFGLWPDPNLNPIGPGPLFFVSFWPAVICLGPGVLQVWHGRWRRGRN
jgi:hypothetical protein